MMRSTEALQRKTTFGEIDLINNEQELQQYESRMTA
ncbi:MAG: hypothetical protein JWP34_5351 [Massilia sp.]|jgi:hypothetical protein|nr:hypothetical protein [Massilia sp.]